MKQNKTKYLIMECPECMLTMEFLKGYEEKSCLICGKELRRVKER